MHSPQQQIVRTKRSFYQSKTIICIWKTYASIFPSRILISDHSLKKPCICVLKSFAVITGTEEGFIQLWDTRYHKAHIRHEEETELSSFLQRRMQAVSLKVPQNEDNCDGNNVRNPIICLAKSSDSDIISLNTLGCLEFWYVLYREKSLCQ